MGLFFFTSFTHSCAEASLLNGIYSLLGREEAVEMAWLFETSGEEPIVMKLQVLGFVLQKYGGGSNRCELVKVPEYQSEIEKGMDKIRVA